MEKISPALLNFLLNATWQVALIAAAASLGARLLRSASAAWRHRLWVAALLIAVALPLAGLLRPVLPTISFVRPRPAAAPVSSSISSASTVAFTDLDTATLDNVSTPARRPLTVPRSLAEVLVAAYMLFVVLRLSGLLRALFATRAIIRHARPLEFSPALQRVVDLCRQQTGVSGVRFLSSASIATPLTAGFAPALVVLPDALLRASDESLLTSAIGHELVHIGRRDYLLNFFYRLLSIPLSFHPAAALIRRRIDETRELRCDELVAARLLHPTAYARSLVELAGAAHAFQRSAATVAVGIADADILEERVMSMLKKTRISAVKSGLLLSAAALIFAVPCIAAVPYAFHLNIAQQATSDKPSAAQPPSQAVKPAAAPSADYEAGLRAGQAYAARTPGDAGQEERAKMKAERDARMNIGFAYEPRSNAAQSPEERVARLKRKLAEEGRSESEMSPEQREKRMVMLKEELATRAKHLAELSKAAKITMQQAIDIATRENPGTVMESSLMGEKRVFTTQPDHGPQAETVIGSPNPVYRVVILSGDDNDPKRTIVLVNAVDGTIVRSVVE